MIWLVATAGTTVAFLGMPEGGLALAQGRFVLHYQPLFSLARRSIVGVEALLRLQTLEGGLVYPDRFIPLAESLGLMVPIGSWVLEQACLALQP